MCYFVNIYILIHQIMVASKKEIHKYKKYAINKSESRYKQYMQYRLLYHRPLGLSTATEKHSKL